MRFSIIIMTYRKFDNLSNNLKSIAKQKFHDYEIILSDDGSDQYDENFIKSLISNEGLSDKVTLIHFSQNVGTVKNYNHAIQNAAGEIIVPLSQDDAFYDENVLEDLNQYFMNEYVEVCCGKSISADNVILPVPMEFEFLRNNDLNVTYSRLIYRNFISGANLYFRKTTWEKIGCFDEEYRLLEDHPFVLKLLANGIRIFPYDRISIIYGRNGISSSKVFRTTTAIDLVKDNVRLYNEIISKKISSYHSTFVKRAHRYRWIVSFHCRLDPKRVKQKKLATYLKYIDISLLHKTFKLVYGHEAEARMSDKLLKLEFLNSKKRKAC